jgi:DNA polymerase-3 subunit beta
MKITVEHNNFNKALANVHAIAGQKRSNVQVLTHVMIEAANNVCTLTTTDLDMQAKSAVPAIVTEEGQITVPAQLLFGIVRALPEGAQIDLTLGEDGQLSLVVGKSNFLLHTIPAADFPKFDAGNFPHHFELPASSLRLLIEKTRFAISADETRYYLNGIYFHVPSDNKEELRAVATDGYRLALCDVDVPKGAEKMPGIIVPRKTITELFRFIENNEGNITMRLSKTMVCFEGEETTLTSKLIDGSFPDYARIIPDKNDKLLALEKKDLAIALQKVAALFIDAPSLVTPLIKLEVKKNKLVLSGTLPGRGSAEDEVAIDYDGTPIEIGFNPTYLLDIIECIDEKVQIKMASSDVAAVVEEGEKNKAGKPFYVLMPMKVG